MKNNKNKYLKINYNKIAEKISNMRYRIYTGTYIRGVAEGRYHSKDVKELLKEFIPSNIKKVDSEYLSIDYVKLAFDVSKNLHKGYGPTYVKKVLAGEYDSCMVLREASRLLESKK